MTDGLIELGERADAEVRARPGRRAPTRTLVGLVAIAVLLGVAGSGGLPPRLSGPVWTVADVTTFWPGQHTIYTLTADAVEARAADTGQVRWRRPLPGQVENLVEVGHGLVAISLLPLAVAGNLDLGDTTALIRVDTGMTVTTLSGHPEAWSDRQLLIDRKRCRSGPACDTVSAVSLPDAVTQWTIDLASAQTISLDQAAGVFSVQSGLLLQLRELSTGQVLRSEGLVPVTITVLPGPDSGSVVSDDPDAFGAIMAGRLVSVGRSAAVITVDSEPLTGPGDGWSVKLPVDPAQPAVPARAQACGPLLCVFTIDGTAVLDPATGAVRGQLDGFVITDASAEIPAQFLVVESQTGVLQVVRASDLAVVESLPLSALMSWRGNGGRMLVGRPAADGISLLVLDRHGGLRPIGTVTGREPRCLARGTVLACLDQRTLTIRRIPSPAQFGDDS